MYRSERGEWKRSLSNDVSEVKIIWTFEKVLTKFLNSLEHNFVSKKGKNKIEIKFSTIFLNINIYNLKMFVQDLEI